MGEQRGLQSLVELRAGVVVDAHAALFEHDLALGTDHFVGEHEIGHAIGLEAHQGLEMLLAYTLEIGGVVVSREGVLLPAKLRDEIREGALVVGPGVRAIATEFCVDISIFPRREAESWGR